MSDQGLQARSPLDGYSETVNGIAIAEVWNRAIVAVAPSQGEEAALNAALEAAHSFSWPAVGQSTLGVGSNARLLGMAPDQAFLCFDHEGPDAVPRVAEALGENIWLTDQSDSWVSLRVSGPGVRDALERICMLDLHPEAFAVGAVSRTTMEHLGVIILREDQDTFLLMSPTSSAESFLDAIVTSARNIVPREIASTRSGQ